MTESRPSSHLRDIKGMKGKKVTLSSGEVAAMLGLSRETVSRLARQGLLPATRLGGSRARYRFRPEAVLELAGASSQRSGGDNG